MLVKNDCVGAYIMSEKNLFNLTETQIKKQSGSKPDKCDYNTPIRRGETLEPCIRGSQKFLNDPQKREMMYRIHRGVKSSGKSLD